MKPRARKICLVTPGYPPRDWGGLARTAQRVAGHLRGLGLEVQVAELLIGEGPVLLDENRESIQVEGIAVHRLKAGREVFADGERTIWDCPHTMTLRMWYQSLRNLHQEQGYDLLCAFFLYPMGYLATLLARSRGIRSLVGLMGNDINKYLFSPEKVGMCRAGLEGADGIVSLSQEMADLARALAPAAPRIDLVLNSSPIPREPWRPRPDRSGPFRLGFAGSFKYAKGLPYLLKALALLGQEVEAELELAGEIRASEAPVFEELKERTGTAGAIRFRGLVPHSEMADWLRGLDCFVLPSISEGCPNILLEAMACGLPCVSTRVGSTPELIEEGVSGLLVPAGDSAALARALVSLAKDPDRAAALGAAARERAVRVFTPEAEMAGWEKALRRIVEF